ncbi:DNA mismatch repair protein MutL [Brevinema andersonii]|uniref:DNA mismatch repair protein MutL n=1 Tax=Brevinema andersonii TaxID=34097 RepID=A0A1I1EDB1_BREAD|nr:DNA mismatch repair endonuclease MutL [Brevinema andersonii]SFB85119.1 DNA mismatch repair protein MutL [Brevinema andersonii]
MSICLLDPSTIMKIAAGEVIERPASAVRELLDNAIDAGANLISVELIAGGKNQIVITDNGVGIREEQITLAPVLHATSKISVFDDLQTLSTFGFRGEALASLAEVSSLTISSKPAKQEFGSSYTIEFGEKKNVLPKGMNSGTQITIADLFKTTPARLKFLGTDSGEYRACVQEFIKKTLAHPHTDFSLHHNNEQKYRLFPVQNILERIHYLFPDTKDILYSFNYQEAYISAWGFISHPSWYKPTRSHQFLFINNRPIEWQGLRQQVHLAYNNLLPPNRFPALFLYLDMDPKHIDFNVHPQKKEVRFENERLIADIIRRSIRQGIEKATNNGGITITKDDNITIRKNYSMPVQTRMPLYNFSPSQKSSSHSQHVSLFESDVSSSPIESQIFSAQYIGTIFSTYLIFESAHIMILVDFHAMHERIRYEKLKKMYNISIERQTIIPYIFEVSKTEADIFEGLSFEKLGFSHTRISETAFSIDAIPSFLSPSRIETILRDLLDLNKNTSLNESYIWDETCKMIACKGSVKSGELLSLEEIQELLREWQILSCPLSCPHGRPITIKISRPFLDKEFKRTGF